MATATVTPNVRKTRKHVCTFDELSDSAKEHAREERRTAEDFDTQFLFQDFETAAKILGIEFAPARGNGDNRKVWEPDIRYSGFCSQGDGASFVGSYSHAPNSPAKIRSEFPTETRLHAIADGLDAMQNGYKLLTGHRLNAKIEQNDHHYVHENTMSVSVEDAETGDELDFTETEDKILELMRDFARWIYRELEADYDYKQSDEYITECLTGCEFDEDGELV